MQVYIQQKYTFTHVWFLPINIYMISNVDKTIFHLKLQ